MSAQMNYLDGNAAAGELSKIFAIDVTAAEGQCTHCGTKKPFRGGTFVHAMSGCRSTLLHLRARPA